MQQAGSEALSRLIAEQTSTACDWPDEQRDGLVRAIRARYGEGVQAIVIYGSYLRGKRDTLLDFYVLVDNYAAMRSWWQAALAWILPPNVYQVRYSGQAGEARAKYALLTLDRFEHALRGNFHSYFWARFVQPSGLVFCRNEAVRHRVIKALGQAARTFVRRVVPCLPDRFAAEDLVTTGLSLTYQCELRAESSGQAKALYDRHAAYYQAMIAALSPAGLGFREADKTDCYCNESSRMTRRRVLAGWWLRRPYGKLLSVLRLLKAALTFADGFDYLLWKIGRHSEITVEATRRQRKYPLIFGWPVLWRLYRRGAFR